MSDETDREDGAAEAEGEEAAGQKKGGLKKKLLMFGLPVVILILGGAGAFLLLGGGGDEKLAEAGHAGAGGDGAHGEATAAAAEELYFYELPEMLVNINSEDGDTKYLKLKLILEIKDPELTAVLDERLPRVMDQYQSFLRELRVEDLAGSAGMYRLKHELLRRANLAVAPAEVNNVLVDEILFR